jgi:hypothetical protein
MGGARRRIADALHCGWPSCGSDRKARGVAGALPSGEVVCPRRAFQKGLASTYESAFEICQFASLLQGAFG